MQKLLPLMVVPFILLFTPLLAQKTPVFKTFQYTSNGDTLPYSMLHPLKPVQGEKYPLVIFLHGAGERGNDNFKNTKHIAILYSTNALNKFPAYVVSPQCPKGEVWSDMMMGKSFSSTPTKPMSMFIQLLDQLMKQYPIDPSRIYVTGVSMGGFGTWDLLARFPDRFAAAVPICGGGDVKIISKIKHIPLWLFHGTLDETVPPSQSRKMVSALWEAGSLPGYTEFPGVEHASWNQAYKEPHLLPWLFRQKLTKTTK